MPITQWPEIERKMGIIARMTSDPPPLKIEGEILELDELEEE